MLLVSAGMLVISSSIFDVALGLTLMGALGGPALSERKMEKRGRNQRRRTATRIKKAGSARLMNSDKSGETRLFQVKANQRSLVLGAIVHLVFAAIFFCDCY
jgi:hypothetical protein